MGMQDRDWYKEETQRKREGQLRSARPRYRLKPRDWFVLGALVATAFWYFAGFLKL
jgi:hypothetical protein